MHFKGNAEIITSAIFFNLNVLQNVLVQQCFVFIPWENWRNQTNLKNTALNQKKLGNDKKALRIIFNIEKFINRLADKNH